MTFQRGCLMSRGTNPHSIILYQLFLPNDPLCLLSSQSKKIIGLTIVSWTYLACSCLYAIFKILLWVKAHFPTLLTLSCSQSHLTVRWFHGSTSGPHKSLPIAIAYCQVFPILWGNWWNIITYCSLFGGIQAYYL